MACQCFSGCSWGTLIAFPLTDAQESCVVTRAHKGSITTLCSSPDGRYVASSGSDGALRIWLWQDLQPHMEITSRGSSIPVTFSSPVTSSLVLQLRIIFRLLFSPSNGAIVLPQLCNKSSKPNFI
ncbi:hypothetical protein PR048_005908 [Dryococelus australis]|uniref:Uncharacterized protein n=1 Tax=Dryococelus australis TaxID=614101 RepID=A0ABQ9IA32_9NEOP|nr:hypothetical protein PR048_005908 [Dryococelus australis]